MAAASWAPWALQRLKPNLINVIAAQAVMSVDLRNTDGDKLQQAQAEVLLARKVAAENGVNFTASWLISHPWRLMRRC